MLELDPLRNFTPARWDKAKRILRGEDNKRVSLAAAARAADVSLTEFRGWINRSESRFEHDDPLVHEVAVVYNESAAWQAGRLEDKAWERAVTGTAKPIIHRGEKTGAHTREVDNRLLEKLLQARDPKYRPAEKLNNAITVMSPEEVYERLIAAKRLTEARTEKPDETAGFDSVLDTSPLTHGEA